MKRALDIIALVVFWAARVVEWAFVSLLVLFFGLVVWSGAEKGVRDAGGFSAWLSEAGIIAAIVIGCLCFFTGLVALLVWAEERVKGRNRQ